LAVLATLAVAAVMGVGCSSGGSGTAPPGDGTTAERAGPADDGGTGDPAGAADPAAPTLVARPAGPVDVFTDPADAGSALTLPAESPFGSPRALPVLDQRDGWLQVDLPVRPNGTTGWIRDDGVAMVEVAHAITIDLAARTLTLTDGGEPVLTTPIAIGTDEYPTPTGRFFVVDKLATGDPDDVYGPFALGLSGHSDVLTEFAGGDGQVGIHGTNDPATIGAAVSHGCVRVPNDVVTTLSDTVALGTLVTIA
jgi:lipoprotein-anchoring transpeptidase ErfK/SrfK